MIKTPSNSESAGSAGLSTPAAVVVIVLLLGGTIYLWRARYIRRKTAYAIMSILVISLVALTVWQYLYPT
jgi:phosphoglycerol transferase MdoB-like AlkP superfamily enzyme